MVRGKSCRSALIEGGVKEQLRIAREGGGGRKGEDPLKGDWFNEPRRKRHFL